MAKIKRIEIKDYRGVRDLSIEVPPSGAVLAGGNAKGKSSVLHAISAALGAQGCGPETIRKGADAAEILVDLDAVRVRRSITAKGSSLAVTNADGDKWSKPQTRLTDLLGSSPIDALAFFLADPKERRRQLLEALPAKITTEDVERWCPGATSILNRVSIEGHGMEALDRLRKAFYDIRADLNRGAKEARGKADAFPVPPPPDDGPSVDEAKAAKEAADEGLRNIRSRASLAVRASTAGEKTRARIQSLKDRAKELRDKAPAMPDDDEIHRAEVAEKRAQEALELAQRESEAAKAKLRAVRQQREDATKAVEEAVRLVNEAGELQESLPVVEQIPAEEIQRAEEAAREAAAALEKAQEAERARREIAAKGELDAAAEKAQADADSIDTIVRTLSSTAPAELAARSNMIPGLGFDGDVISLDGVPLDGLSGAEQMRFAVTLARRLNEKARILVVDGLERLDADALNGFIALATADGFQLFATRVTGGELVVEAIETDEAA